MPVIQKVKIELLTEEAFQPFGHIVGLRNSPPNYRGGGNSQGWWVDFQTEGKPLVSVITVPYGNLSFTKMERHFQVSQNIQKVELLS